VGGLLQGKQQAVACAILRRRHPRPALLALPAIADEVPNPFQARAAPSAAPSPAAPFGLRRAASPITSTQARLNSSTQPTSTAPSSG